MKAGWVYVLPNPGMPGLIKIGFTKHPPHQRARELYGTGVAFPFEVAYQARCRHYQSVERMAHERLDDKRVNGGREFFACKVAEAVATIRLCAGEDLLGEEDFSGEAGVLLQPMPSENPRLQVNEVALGRRHLLVGLAVFALVIAGGWWLFDLGAADDEPASDKTVANVYSAATTGQKSLYLRACPSADCSVVAVLPPMQSIQINRDSLTDGGWIYAEFRGDICYPQHFAQKDGCRQVARNMLVEGWMEMSHLAGTKRKPSGENASGFDALF